MSEITHNNLSDTVKKFKPLWLKIFSHWSHLSFLIGQTDVL